MRRRPFLHRIWSALGLLLVGGFSGLSLRALGRAGRRRDAPPAFPDALIAGLGVGEARIEGGWLLSRRGGDELLALSLRCTHLGCTLQATAEGALVCPCHRSRFDAEGRPLSGPAVAPLERHRLERRGARWVAPGSTP